MKDFSLHSGLTILNYFIMCINQQKRESSFFRDLLYLNGIAPENVGEFVFHRGMCFGDREKWWGKGGTRESSHEGVDIVYYRERGGAVKRLAPGTLVPAAFSGELVLVIDDLLGKSLFLRHGRKTSGTPLFSILAHVTPLEKIIPGQTVSAGEPVAEIAELPGKNFNICPHLHLSMALIEKDLDPANISWELIGKSEKIHLIDPVEYLRPL
jgi:murein DD-endopeptidase MepM/ murein hydrolase activator NlpD